MQIEIPFLLSKARVHFTATRAGQDYHYLIHRVEYETEGRNPAGFWRHTWEKVEIPAWLYRAIQNYMYDDKSVSDQVDEELAG